ncbi:hypothetical protein DEU42_103200 [Flavobacterium sp. AG291]|nr:hypothetical protein DEU42_103200 [Flavobacterium sp. AG291]
MNLKQLISLKFILTIIAVITTGIFYNSNYNSLTEFLIFFISFGIFYMLNVKIEEVKKNSNDQGEML